MARVLVVADATHVRDDVVGALARRGVEAIVTDDPRRVLALVDEHEPDIVICDSQVSSMGVVAVCRELRGAAGTGDVDPVGFVALLDRRPDVFLARRAGADAWLVKPFEPAALRWTVDVLLGPGVWNEESLAAELSGHGAFPEPTPEEAEEIHELRTDGPDAEVNADAIATDEVSEDADLSETVTSDTPDLSDATTSD